MKIMIDFAIAKAINQLGAGTFLDSLTLLVSSYIFLFAVFALIIALIFIRDKKRARVIVLALIIALLLHFLITGIVMKEFVANNIYFKERPYVTYPNEITQIGDADTDTAFPSGHVALVMVLLTTLVYYYRKYWPYATLFVLFMGFSRVHNGMHYPSDVLFGALFGLIYSLIAVKSLNCFLQKKIKIPN